MLVVLAGPNSFVGRVMAYPRERYELPCREVYVLAVALQSSPENLISEMYH